MSAVGSGLLPVFGKPLVIPIDFLSGEGLADAVVRAAALNCYDTTHTVLEAAGMDGRYAAGVASRAIGQEDALAATLGISGAFLPSVPSSMLQIRIGMDGTNFSVLVFALPTGRCSAAGRLPVPSASPCILGPFDRSSVLIRSGNERVSSREMSGVRAIFRIHPDFRSSLLRTLRNY